MRSGFSCSNGQRENAATEPTNSRRVVPSVMKFLRPLASRRGFSWRLQWLGLADHLLLKQTHAPLERWRVVRYRSKREGGYKRSSANAQASPSYLPRHGTQGKCQWYVDAWPATFPK